MKELSLEKLEEIQGGYDVETCMGVSVALMSMGIWFAFSGPVGVGLLLGGAVLGAACSPY
jgi:hypothetical protein